MHVFSPDPAAPDPASPDDRRAPSRRRPVQPAPATQLPAVPAWLTETGVIQRDRYGLTLSTTPAAAEFYNIALDRILRVRPGADVALRAAIRADPDFALAHAGLALLGHEHGEPIDVQAELAAATQAAQRCSDREYSQIAAIMARVKGAGPGLIRRHLAAYP